jgi:PTH1 family peptidyl-tRNA hydrolase
VGIGRSHEGGDAAERVLEEFAPEELPVAVEMVGRAASAVQTLLTSGLVAAMDRYNMRAPVPEASP